MAKSRRVAGIMAEWRPTFTTSGSPGSGYPGFCVSVDVSQRNGQRDKHTGKYSVFVETGSMSSALSVAKQLGTVEIWSMIPEVY